jgi:hypothetical protein
MFPGFWAHPEARRIRQVEAPGVRISVPGRRAPLANHELRRDRRRGHTLRPHTKLHHAAMHWREDTRTPHKIRRLCRVKAAPIPERSRVRMPRKRVVGQS